MAVLAMVASGLGVTTAPPADASIATSLPTVSSGARPGPDVLYAPAPRAPQLENRDDRFRQPYDRVSGTERYADGEYSYTDHLYDDTGAGARLTYPTDQARFAGNAADLVELRMAAEADEVAYRFTLNALVESDTTIVALAFDTDRNAETGSATLPRRPGSPFPGTDAVLTTWGTGAEWSRWNGMTWTSTPVAARVDLEANQITVSVPRTVADPRGSWRATLAVGLHDPGTGGWLRPGAVATTTHPGGANLVDTDPSAIFNLGFRFDEPILRSSAAPDEAQAAALADDAPARFAHDIDFAALDAGVDRTTVPTSGTMVRFLPSRLDRGEGKNLEGFPATLGQLQPYSLYVPTGYDAATPAGFTLDLHSLGENHWQYNGSTGVQQLGEQRSNLVATPHARGEDGWYQHEAEYDVFEVWNDVAAHFALDPDRVALTGYSMGGYGTYRFATLYPDLFGKAMTVVGPPGDGIWVPPAAPTGGIETLTNQWLENVRHIPFLNIAAVLDELVPIAGPTQQNVGAAGPSGLQSFDSLGYRFRFQTFPTAEHLTLALLSYNLPQAVSFFGDSRVVRDPAHVTFGYTPAADDRALGLVHDHAYWVSGVRLADPAVGSPLPEAVVDVHSHATGVGDPTSKRGTATGTTPLPYDEISRTWGPTPTIPKANTLVATLTNVGSATLDARRAGLDPRQNVTLEVSATHAGKVRLVADGKVVEVAINPGTATYTVTRARLASGGHAA
ncbi:prolyl oligopeptidase family serine peptidase [Blastococcus goldschmidtiae]|uniref:Prolyl oligopeptidase family serine peptidase n=1 Tax=Blastococcus goldschmidtiae TaxID=3075546 RepID=A0ABU2KA84_9ACTN|nr:prolyl oligopeptidase family serine peptidase [Blastococcus sp. DSM 46792]MDT0277110.1 prolyl oligopeptidase family serine peptidase [Blastococcus sp. DSM 46792]